MPLHYALDVLPEKQAEGMVTFLVETMGADPNVFDKSDDSPLDTVLQRYSDPQCRLVTVLAKLGARPTGLIQTKFIHLVGKTIFKI